MLESEEVPLESVHRDFGGGGRVRVVATGCRVFLVSILADLTFRLGGIMCVMGRPVVWELQIL